MEVSVKVDVSDVLKHFDTKTQLNLQRSIINKMGREARKETKKRILDKYNIKSGAVYIKLVNARTSNLICKLKARKKPLSLTRFDPQQSMQGTTVSVLKGQTTYIEGAFIAQPHGRDWSKYGQQTTDVISRYPLVFKRFGVRPYKIDTKQLRDLYSLSVGQYLKSDENMNAINDMMKREHGNIERAIVAAWKGRRLDKLFPQEGGTE